MIFDLLQTAPPEPQTADVCIVGGGIAGLVLAHRLRRHGRTVLVLESGPPTSDAKDHPLNVVETDARPYLGATAGRARGLGGTSSKWGGALIPFLPADFEARPEIGRPGWPVRFDEVSPYLADIEALFQAPPGAYDEAFLDELGAPTPFARNDPDILPRFAKWPRFTHRNIAHLLHSQLQQDADLRIWANATATTFHLREDGALDGITATNEAGTSIRVQAARFVFAAGAIESTRLALILNQQSGARAFGQSDRLGLGFHDHVSIAAADIITDAPTALNRLGGFRFHKGAMRSARFELSPGAQKAEAAPSSFGHIAFHSLRASGFDRLRDALRALQAEGRIDITKFAATLQDAPYLAQAAQWRYLKRQLLWPRPARYDLHIVTEQVPADRNRITLSAKTDALGMPLARLSWHVGAQEFGAIQAFGRRFAAYWRRHGYEAVGRLAWRFDISEPSAAFPEGGADIFHPGGTTAMATDARSGVVDSNLTAFGVPNLSICATSAFPTGASANPTLMLMAFAARLGDHLHRTLSTTRGARRAPSRETP